MRAPQWVSDFFEWRWAPCVGLTAGSLAFVALALVLIPTQLGGEPHVANTLSAYESPHPQRAIFNSALARPETDAEERRVEVARNARVARAVATSVPRTSEAAPAPQRGFSPILERPEPVPPPAAPVPPPAPAAVPAAAPTTADAPAAAPSTVLIQPVPGGEAREVPP
jgi:hypothetical protein